MCITPWSQVTQISEKALRCASYGGVKLCGLHPKADLSCAPCITPGSHPAHRGVRIKKFDARWLLLKGQLGEILLGVNTSIMKEKI